MKKVVVALPSVGNIHGLEIIAKLRTTLKANGYLPVFYLGMSRKHATRQFTKAIKRHKDVKFAFTNKPGFGNGVITAINKGIKHENPHAVVTLPDDYIVEAGYMHKLLDRLHEHDMVTGSWDRISWRTFPVPQFLNEVGSSLLVTYANPKFVPKKTEGLMNFTGAVSRGRAVQTLAGMFAFTPQAWKRIHKELQEFKPEHIANSGIEVAISLSSLKLGLNIAHRRVPRRFEHEIPRGEAEKKHRFSRGKQFEDSIAVIKHFLERTGQKEKIAHVDAQAKRIRDRIEERAILRLGQRVIERKTKMGSVMHLK